MGEQDVTVRGKTIHKHFFGTIPYTELDDSGCMKRGMNGGEMCIGDDIDKAIKSREFRIKAEAWEKEHPNHTTEEFIKFMMAI